MNDVIVSGVAVLVAAALVFLDVVLDHIRRIPDRRDSATEHRRLMSELNRHNQPGTPNPRDAGSTY